MTELGWDWNWTRDALEEEFPMAHRLRRMHNVDPATRPRAAAALACMRRIMTAVHAFEACGRPQCRRAGACLAPRVECAFRKLPWLQRDIFPLLAKLVDDGAGKVVVSPEIQVALLLARPGGVQLGRDIVSRADAAGQLAEKRPPGARRRRHDDFRRNVR